MLLKRVSITGFKSFADKVDFDFGRGVTCIVGPNGCGKSNVVDAVKWVLGEQSARSLRGRQMIDMIFAGSSARKSSGLAQVDLHFDNSRRMLALDRDEVVVTRKLYRSGDSEYLLNGETGRLKDIRELFMDTGVGTEAYSVIEQGKVDILLQSSPTERRLIFEEAAGISKYKTRKREAERKMERTEQNLLRVADIIEEVEKRLRSVKLQAGKARNFLEYDARLKELKATYSMAEYHRLSTGLAAIEAEAEQHQDRVTGLKTRIGQLETEEVQLASRLDRLAEEISEADAQLARTQAESTTQNDRVEAGRRRIEEQRAATARCDLREAEDRRRLEVAQQELVRVETLADDLQRQTQELRGRIDELNERDGGLSRELAQSVAMLEDEKAGIIELLRRSTSTHNEIIRLNAHHESLVGQKDRLADRDAQIRVDLAAHLERKADMERRLAEVEELISAETRRLEEKKADGTRIDSLRQRLVDELAQHRERRSALGSRQSLLADLERKKDGLGAGARQLLELKDTLHGEGRFAPVLGLVADLFTTDVSHAHIIEAALGDSDQHVVISDTDAFLAEVATLGRLPGRVTCVCLDRVPPLVNPRDFVHQPGVVARAVDLVRFEPAYEALALHLFGKTIVVDTLDHATALARADLSGHRFVTVAGEVVEPDGRIRLGPAASHAGLISRKSELRDIDVQLAMADERIAQLAEELNRTQAEAGHNERMQQELRAAIYESNTARVEARAALSNVQEAIRRLTEEQPLIAGEVSLIEGQIADVYARSEAGGRSLKEMEEENQRREQISAGHQSRIEGLRAARTAVQEELTELRVSAGQLSEKRAAAGETLATLRRQVVDLTGSLEAVTADREQCVARIAEAEEVIESARRQLLALAEAVARLESLGADLRRQREGLRVRVEEVGGSLKAARSELSEAEGLLHEAEMGIAQTRVRRDELCARVLADLGIPLAERYEEYEHADQDWAAVEAEMNELRAKIERLGNVNLDAISELEELEKRAEFLTTQRADLTDSIDQLRQLIERLNTESHERFVAAFQVIRDNFRTLFRKLFGGGRADIVLEDEGNPLDCGIEILAQPPGKELRGISLMSGGEKTMTAIALLMSIFKSRPAPYAILDEVDAALDELNNERFNRIIGEFVAESQFIIITHSKRTMSIADTLYGITMQEPGVSTRVSVQIGSNVA